MQIQKTKLTQQILHNNRILRYFAIMTFLCNFTALLSNLQEKNIDFKNFSYSLFSLIYVLTII
jgi:hypothetical protein